MPSLNDNELQLILTLVDKASADFKKVNQQAIQSLNEVKKSVDDTAKKTEDANKRTEKSWFRLTVTIASVLQIMRVLGNSLKDIVRIGRETDSSFNQAFSSFEASVKNVKKSIADQLTPALTVALDYWSKFLNSKVEGSLVESFKTDLKDAEERLRSLRQERDSLASGNKSRKSDPIYGMPFTTPIIVDIPIENNLSEVDELIKREEALIENIKKRIETAREANQAENERVAALSRAKLAMDEFKKAQEEAALLFVTSKDNASSYYDSLLEAQSSVLSKNQLIAEDLRNLAALQAQLDDESITRSRNQIQEQISLLQFYQQEQRIAQQGIATLIVQVGQTMQTSLSSAITGVIMGTKNARDAFKEFGKAMVESVVNFIAQKIVAATIEKTLLAGTVATSSAAGAAIAAAWAPAAAMVSLATLGSNAAPAMAAITTTNALATGLASLSGVKASVGDVAGLAKSLGSMSPRGLTQRAYGGDDIITKPTLFMAGEGNRPERVTVSPVGGRDYHGSGSINIYIGTAVMDSAAGVSSTAEMLGSQIENSIRRARSF